MKKALLILILFVTTSNFFGQDLSGYKYVYVPTLTYQNGGTDIWSISSNLRTLFMQKGFTVLNESSNPTQDLQQNPCLLLTCFIDHTNVTVGTNSVTLILKDCNNKIVITSKGSAAGWSVQDDFNKATKRAFRDIENLPYRFNPEKTAKLDLPEVEKTNETEQSLTTYFDTNAIDEIEGIYKSYQSDQLGYYKFGIKKYGSKYKAIIIESDMNYWKAGEVKAVFEPSSMKGFYSTKWYMGNKTSFETFALMENPALFSVEFKDLKTGEKRTDKFIKMYPSAEVQSTAGIDGVRATGSGFVISTDGVIATNAHVIEDAERIEIVLHSEIGTKTYSASVLLKDESNDVALLKIEDDDFRGFNSIPFSVLQTTEIGEDIFTIGYPLNSLMGDNYKVTDGIVSSNTGLKDDIRFMQITAPIQPGNSGGPLFNKDGNVIGLTTSKLNEKAVGTSIENVNYAIKAIYLINIYNMLPNSVKLSENTNLSNKTLQEQVKTLKNYVCLIKVY
ncbi:MAG: S1-C subfamily serine protease [Marinoscillum sp.]|jgi:S1-C subfamily serine protease